MRTAVLLVALLVMAPTALASQVDGRLAGRWVGTHRREALHLDFYADTMLVVNDRYAAHYRLRGDSLIVEGDTVFAVSYWFVMDRLLIHAGEGNVITMSRQSELARPIDGRWRGSVIGREERIELLLGRDGTARWRRLPTGGWTWGEWERKTRNINFTWLPDSTTWTGFYDPARNNLLFEEVYPGSGTAVLQRVFRW